VSARRELGQGVVRLIASTSAINGLLVRALPEFNRANPAIQVQVREGERDDQMLAIARGEIDLALCRQPPVVPEGWSFHALLEDRFVVACAADHPLARRRNRPDRFGRTDLLPSPAGSAVASISMRCSRRLLRSGSAR
jgi:DNA-binding transcriptional LysR family regulator